MVPQATGRKPVRGDVREVGLFDVAYINAGLEHLKGLPELRAIWLANVGDAGLAHLEGLTQVQELRLDDTKVSDAGLEYLKGLTQLQELHLSGTKVSDAGLEHLKGLSPTPRAEPRRTPRSATPGWNTSRD